MIAYRVRFSRTYTGCNPVLELHLSSSVQHRRAEMIDKPSYHRTPEAMMVLQWNIGSVDRTSITCKAFLSSKMTAPGNLNAKRVAAHSPSAARHALLDSLSTF